MILSETIMAFGVFVLGTIFGSFLNVLVLRTGSGTHLSGRSKCMSCGKKLSFLMLVPLFSFLFQGGRCRHCGAKISWQYPLVEVTLGLLFVLVWRVTGFDPLTSGTADWSFFLLYCALWTLLLGILVYDLRHKIIPDRFSFCFALIAGVALFLRLKWGLIEPNFVPLLGVYIEPWVNIFAGPFLATPFAALWFFSGGRAMGLGDAKLAWGLGWFLGISGGISAAIFAFWAAFFPSLILLFLPRKHFTMKSEIPFAPFLIFGALIVFAWGIDIFQWSLPS